MKVIIMTTEENNSQQDQIDIENKSQQAQIADVENFFKMAFVADKATLIPVTAKMKEKIEIKSLVKLDTEDRGSFYISMISCEAVDEFRDKT